MNNSSLYVKYFYVHTINKMVDIIAIITDEPLEVINPHDTYLSYTRVGQHGDSSGKFILELKECTNSGEIQDLNSELQTIYNNRLIYTGE